MITISKLREYGADVNSGLARCVNNEALYLRLVAMVPNNDSFKKLYDAINNNDLDSAFLAAHSLKGISANLSINPIVDPVVEITELLRTKTAMDYSGLVSRIEEARKKLEELYN